MQLLDEIEKKIKIKNNFVFFQTDENQSMLVQLLKSRHYLKLQMKVFHCLDLKCTQATQLVLIKLEQLERLRSEDTPRRLMITHTIESCWIPSQN